MKTIVAAAVGECVHVAGPLNFLKLAEEQGYETTFLGPAVSIEELLGAVIETDPDIVAVGYRLTPETARYLFMELGQAIMETGLEDKVFIFGGTDPVAKVAKESGIFAEVFGGSTPIEEIVAFLKGKERATGEISYPGSLKGRIEWKAPWPVIRHHFGLPTLEDTEAGIRKISEAKVLDIISLGLDQNAQEAFFQPELGKKSQDGAGGVPVRSFEDFRSLFLVSRTGNYPLIRSYSGTKDLVPLADVLHRSINNAWSAIPLTWYSVLDGRGPRSVAERVRESQEVARWHGERDIPVEMNESHHWSLRDAHDTIAVAMAYLAAYNAKESGVKEYIAQYMWNTPPGTSFRMDLAKMLAKKELIESLHDEGFVTYRQVRTGLSSYPADLDMAKGQLASSTLLQMALEPHIVHVVSFSEADHAATADDVIESCRIAGQVIRNAMLGLPDMTADPLVQERKEELLREAKILLEAINSLGQDGLINPDAISKAIEIGLLDAPHFKGNRFARGELKTREVNGAYYAIDDNGKILREEERIDRVFKKYLNRS